MGEGIVIMGCSVLPQFLLAAFSIFSVAFSFPIRHSLTLTVLAPALHCHVFHFSLAGISSMNLTSGPFQSLHTLIDFSCSQHCGNAHGGHYHALIRDLMGSKGTGPCSATRSEEGPAAESHNGEGNSDSKKLLSERLAEELEGGAAICGQAASGSGSADGCGILRKSQGGEIDEETYDEHPELLVRDLMSQWAVLNPKQSRMTVADIGKEIFEQKGFSWNRKHRKKHGKLQDFLVNRPLLFSVSKPVSQDSLVRLLKVGAPHFEKICTRESDKKAQGAGGVGIGSGAAPNLGGHDSLPGEWYDFNDSNVTNVGVKALEDYYEGKESAYMLFYRRKGFGYAAPGDGGAARSCASHHGVDVFPGKDAALRGGLPCLPKHLVGEIEEHCKSLEKRRERHANLANLFTADVFMEGAYRVENGALQCISPTEFVSVEGDRREPASVFVDRVCGLLRLRADLSETDRKLLEDPSSLCLHQVQSREAGQHVFPLIPTGEDGHKISPTLFYRFSLGLLFFLPAALSFSSLSM